ncbi:MAG: hypothetical protein OEV78_12585 [Spirochaetia bacterium]|nr:hypothetical protein [Spirochaetia bacterium]
MKNLRVFLMVSFYDEEILIRLLELIHDKVGKYDYFTQNIYLDNNNVSDKLRKKIRIFSFKKLIQKDDLENYFYTINKLIYIVKNDQANSFFGYVGYMSKFHVVSLSGEESPLYLQIGKKLFGKIELLIENRKLISMDGNNELFSNKFSIRFFEDLYRIYTKNT